MVNWASYGPATDRFYEELWEQRQSIGALVKNHLALSKRDTCVVLPPSRWIRGSFNVCIFIDVNSKSSYKKVVFRCPMPYKLAEARYPGSIDEKLSCEVGASIWVDENCPEIRSAFLLGFGFSDGRHVCPASNPFKYYCRSLASLHIQNICHFSLVLAVCYGVLSTKFSDFRYFPTIFTIRWAIKYARRTWCWNI